MILSCPSCSAKFLVPDSAFVKGARTVRCGKCQHSWMAEAPAPSPFAEPTTAKDTSDKKSPSSAGPIEAALRDSDAVLAKEPKFSAKRPNAEHIYDHKQLPVVVRTLDAGPSMFALTISLVLLIVGLGIIVAAPSWQHIGWLKPLYRTIGLVESDGLQLSALEYQKIETGVGTRYKISCKIKNTSEKARQMPQMSLQLLSKDGSVLMKENDLLPSGKIIEAGATIDCDIPSPPLRFGSAQTFVIDIGAPLTVSQRPSQLY